MTNLLKLTRPEIIRILELYPDPRQDLEYLERLREYMRQKVDLQQLNAQAEGFIEF